MVIVWDKGRKRGRMVLHVRHSETSYMLYLIVKQKPEKQNMIKYYLIFIYFAKETKNWALHQFQNVVGVLPKNIYFCEIFTWTEFTLWKIKSFLLWRRKLITYRVSLGLLCLISNHSLLDRLQTTLETKVAVLFVVRLITDTREYVLSLLRCFNFLPQSTVGVAWWEGQETMRESLV